MSLNLVDDSAAQGKRLPWLFAGLLLALNLPNLVWLDGFSTLLLNVTDFAERLLVCVLLGASFLALFFFKLLI